MKTREELLRDDMQRQWQCEKCHQLNSSMDYLCTGCMELKPALLRLDYDNVYRSYDSEPPTAWAIWDELGFKPGLKSGWGLSDDSIDDDPEHEEQIAAEKRRKQKKQTLRQKLAAFFRQR